MAVAIVSVLPLLMARLAVERAELRQVDAKLRLMGAAVEEANELIVIVSRDGHIRHANRAFCQAVGYELADLMDQSRASVIADESLPKLEEVKNRRQRDRHGTARSSTAAATARRSRPRAPSCR